MGCSIFIVEGRCERLSLRQCTIFGCSICHGSLHSVGQVKSCDKPHSLGILAFRERLQVMWKHQGVVREGVDIEGECGPPTVTL